MKLSVVIPVRNGADTIGEQIAALAADAEASTAVAEQGLPLEVVIADNGSTDALASACQGFDPTLDVRIVDASQTRGSAHARNVGVRNATGDLLLFCDADDIVRSGWIDALATALDEDDLVGGRLDGTRINNTTVAGWRSPRTEDGLSVPEGFLPFAPSGNLGVRRTAWEAIDGMSTDYRRSHDVEFSWRAQLAGLTIGWAPDAVIDYRYRPTATATFAQGRASGEAMAHLHADFAAQGLRGRPLRSTVRDWAWLVVRLPMLADPARRGTWARRAGQTVGRLEGSVRHRTRYL